MSQKEMSFTSVCLQNKDHIAPVGLGQCVKTLLEVLQPSTVWQQLRSTGLSLWLHHSLELLPPAPAPTPTPKGNLPGPFIAGFQIINSEFLSKRSLGLLVFSFHCQFHCLMLILPLFLFKAFLVLFKMFDWVVILSCKMHHTRGIYKRYELREQLNCFRDLPQKGTIILGAKETNE